MVESPLIDTRDIQVAFQWALVHCTYATVIGPWDFRGSNPVNFFHHLKTFECQGLSFPPKLLCCMSQACQTKEGLCSNMSVLPREWMSREAIPEASCLAGMEPGANNSSRPSHCQQGEGYVLEVHAPHCRSAPQVQENPGESKSQLHHRSHPNRGVQVICKHGCHLWWWK